MQTNANTSVESHDVETWSAWASRANSAYIGFLTLTLVATVLIVVFNNRLNKAKDAAYGREKQASDERIADANAGAAEANRKAAEANEGLAKSGEKIAALTKEAEQAKTERAEADKQIAIAKADAAKASEGTATATAEVSRLRITVANAETERAKAEKSLLQLQEKIKDRHLTVEQRSHLVEFLTKSLKGQIEVRCVIGNPEARQLALEYLDVFKTAGWEVGLMDRVLIMPTPVGIKLWTHSDQVTPEGAPITDNVPDRALSIIGAFEHAHLPIEVQFNHEMPKDILYLIVGYKP
jgi:hypothetical protein